MHYIHFTKAITMSLRYLGLSIFSFSNSELPVIDHSLIAIGVKLQIYAVGGIV